MTTSDDPYQVLGVLPTSDDVVIRGAYKALMLKYHPDTNSTSEAADRAVAINAAYAVVGNAERRAEYDAKHQVQTPTTPFHDNEPNDLQAGVAMVRHRRTSWPTTSAMVAAATMGVVALGVAVLHPHRGGRMDQGHATSGPQIVRPHADRRGPPPMGSPRVGANMIEVFDRTAQRRSSAPIDQPSGRTGAAVRPSMGLTGVNPFTDGGPPRPR